MLERLTDVATFAMYQLVLAVGIVLLPVAVLARRVGLRLPLHRVLQWSDRAFRARRT